MTSRWHKILFGLAACLLLILVAIGVQRNASLRNEPSGQIAYESFDDQESAIYLMNPDGSQRSQVMSVNAFSLVCCATWSTDGKQLAYAVQKYDPTSPTSVVETIDIFDAATRRQTAVKCSTYLGHSCSDRGVFRLRWSRGDQCFTWITHDSMTDFLREIPAKSGANDEGSVPCGKDLPWIDGHTVLGFNEDFTYSPDRKWFLRAGLSTEMEYHSYLFSTSGISRELGAEMIRWFAWSPDSTFLAFTLFDDTVANKNPLYLMSVNDKRPLPVIAELYVKGDPTWSPDSRWVAFSAAGPDGNIDIYKVNIETKEVTRLTTDPAQDRNPTWQPVP